MSKLIRHTDGSVSIRASEDVIKKLICLSGYVIDTEMAQIGDDVDWDSPLHPDNCMDILKQKVAEVDIDDKGNISVFCHFEVRDV